MTCSVPINDVILLRQSVMKKMHAQAGTKSTASLASSMSTTHITSAVSSLVCEICSVSAETSPAELLRMEGSF